MESSGPSRLKRDALGREDLGILGERIGCEYLKKKGYRIRELRYVNRIGYRLGEIDIVATKGRKLVFVEVKTRKFRSGKECLPEESITAKKLFRLHRIIACYLRERRCVTREFSLDALSIVYDETTKTAKVRHFQDIFL